MGITACDAVKVKSDLRLMAQELWSSVKTLLEAPQTWLKILIIDISQSCARIISRTILTTCTICTKMEVQRKGERYAYN